LSKSINIQSYNIQMLYTVVHIIVVQCILKKTFTCKTYLITSTCCRENSHEHIIVGNSNTKHV